MIQNPLAVQSGVKVATYVGTTTRKVTINCDFVPQMVIGLFIVTESYDYGRNRDHIHFIAKRGEEVEGARLEASDTSYIRYYPSNAYDPPIVSWGNSAVTITNESVEDAQWHYFVFDQAI